MQAAALPLCYRSQCSNNGIDRCGGCKSVYYCSRACQTLSWRETHKQECKSLAALTADVDTLDMFAVPPGTAAVHAALPSSDTTKVYLTGASAGLGRLTARYYAGSVRRSLAHMRRCVTAGSMDTETLRRTLRELRLHQMVLDAPPTPAKYQEAIGGMVNALERWHCLRLAIRDTPLPWMTLEEGEAYEHSNNELAGSAAATELETGGARSYPGLASASASASSEEAAGMPALTFMG